MPHTSAPRIAVGPVIRLSSVLDKIRGPLDSYSFKYKDEWIEYVQQSTSHISSRIFLSASVIELGAGVHNPLACAISALARGAKSTLVIEPGSLDGNFVAHGLEHALLTAAMLRPAPAIISDISLQLIAHLKDPEALQSLDIPEMRIEPSVPRGNDTIYSIVHSKAVLEHVDDLRTLLAQLDRITTRDVVHVHEIDFIDHDYYDKRVPEEIDKFAFMFRGVSPQNQTCNMLRYPEVLAIFAEFGFKEVEARTELFRGSFRPEYRELLDERFKKFSDEDLAVTSARLVFRKHK